MKKHLFALPSAIAALMFVFTACSSDEQGVAVTGISLDSTALYVDIGETGTLTATISPPEATNKGVTWSLVNGSGGEVASLSPATGTSPSTVTITPIKPGTARIRAKADDGGFEKTCSLIVEVPVTDITLDRTSLVIEMGQTGSLTATIEPPEAAEKGVTWSLVDGTDGQVARLSVVTGDSPSTVSITPLKPGTTTIRARSDGGFFEKRCTLTVLPGITPVIGISLSEETMLIEEVLLPYMSVVSGPGYYLTATISPPDGANQGITWSFENGADGVIAAFWAPNDFPSGWGNILKRTSPSTVRIGAYKEGRTTIKAKADGGDFEKTCALEVRFTQNPNPFTIYLDTETLSIPMGSTGTIHATLNFSFTNNIVAPTAPLGSPLITWSFVNGEDDKVACFYGNMDIYVLSGNPGCPMESRVTIKPVKEGKTTIKVVANPNVYGPDVEATCELTVTE